MTYFTIPPSAKLSNFVRCFWVLESDHPYIHRSMADVCSELVFHYHGQFEELSGGKSALASLTAMQGPSQQVRRFKIDETFGIFGVYMYPYSIPIFFKMPATELSNQMPDLESVMGKQGVALEEKMMLADSNEERIKIITGFLEKRLEEYQQQEHGVISSIQFIIRSKGLVKIDQVADHYCVSRRQFERKFKEYSGLTPKLFSRIVRFNAACAHFGETSKSLTGIAHECGYYDQSHFIHDFKEFSGLHPKNYFSGKAEGTEWKSS